MVRVFPMHRRLAHDGQRNFTGGFETIHTLPAKAVALREFRSQEAATATVFACHQAHQSTSGIFYGSNPFDDPFAALLFDVVLIILIIHILHFLLRPLNQPKIVSQIIGGMIIGPSVLGRNKNFSAALFPEDAKFLLANIGVIGFMYFLFISGVKMDLSLIRKSGKKEFYVALISVVIPMALNVSLGFILRKSLDKDLAVVSSIGAVSASLSITAFPVIYLVLEELNLLSSEVGRMALSTSVISDAVGINAMVAFEAAKQGEVDWKNALWYLISLLLLMAFFVVCVRKVMLWIVGKTPAGKPVDQAYVVGILLAVLVMGFLTDMFGAAIANGPLWLGLVIPDGPPLGSTLVERSETIIMELLVPISFAFIGLYTDIFAMAMAGWPALAPLFFIAAAGYVFKMVATLLASLYFDVPLRDSLAVSLMLSLRGQVELIVFVHWIDKKVIKIPAFTMLVLLTATVTAIATPLISFLYDPTRPYMVNKRRTIQHTAPGTSLRIVLCIEDQESLLGLVNFLEISNPTINNPFSIYALHLLELVGRAAPVFIDHKKQQVSNKYTASDSIHNALRLYREARSDMVKLHTYTAVAPKRSMNQDICELALIKKANLIILPFKKGAVISGPAIESAKVRLHSVNSSVLDHAPCSVGIFVDKGHLHNSMMRQSFWNSAQHLAVLFLGGADAREALAYADRMIANLDVCITVVRFLSYNSRGDNELEKKLDDGVVTWFWVKNEGNERVIYREVVVSNGAETIAAIQSLNDESFELLIVGRQQGINPVLLEGLSYWSENKELGIIGDYVASADFRAAASVLVMQQQVLRGQGQLSSSFYDKFRFHLR